MALTEDLKKDLSQLKGDLTRTGHAVKKAAGDAAKVAQEKGGQAFDAAKEKGGQVVDAAKKAGDEASKKAGAAADAIKTKAEEVTGKDLDGDGKVGK